MTTMVMAHILPHDAAGNGWASRGNTEARHRKRELWALKYWIRMVMAMIPRLLRGLNGVLSTGSG